MRALIRGLFIGSVVCFLAAFSGCGGSGEDEVLDYDPEESKKQSAAYEEQMKEQMKNQGPPGGRR